MKKIIFLLTMGFCGVVAAQTSNVVKSAFVVPAPMAAKATTNAPAKPHGPTEIISDMADFDLNLHQAIYRGHVRVTDPEVKLTCDWLVVDLPAAGEHLSHVLADTNVVVDFTDEKGEKYHVTSARAVYAYKVVGAVTNETVVFTGPPKPKVVTTNSVIVSEQMTWDRVRDHFNFVSPIMNSTSGINSGGGSNAPAMKLF
jgi:lipopolysaccharide export system protein LptA